MICDTCKHLNSRNQYKIDCELQEHYLLNVKECKHYEKE